MADIYQAICVVLQGILEERCVGASIGLGVIEQAFKGVAAISVVKVVAEGGG